MQAYIYRANIYCAKCGEAMIDRAKTHGVKDTGDSGDFPQGPYSRGGGEADSPQHCGECHVFLENPLTDDGRVMVMECVNEEWDKFYDVVREDAEEGVKS